MFSGFSRMLKKAKNRLLTRASRKRGHGFGGAYKDATVRERGSGTFFQHPARLVRGAFFCIALATFGCSRQPTTAAAASSSPAAGVPVGPLPGVTAQPPLPENPLGQNPVALAQGRYLFVKYNCSGCHGGHAGGGMGPSLRDNVWIYGGEDAHIYASIAEGRAKGMPSWGAKIPQEEIWQLVAYIKSMRTPREPEAPK